MHKRDAAILLVFAISAARPGAKPL